MSTQTPRPGDATQPSPESTGAAGQASAPAPEKKANARPEYAKHARGHGPHGAAPAEKAMNFGPSLKRLLRTLGQDRPTLVAVVLMGAIGVAFNVVAPKILGKATDVIFAGVVGKQIGAHAPAGTTPEQLAAGLRARGDGKLADMVASMPYLRVGQGIDFGHLGRILLLCAGMFVLASLLMFLQSWLLTRVVNRAVFRLRRDVSTKLDRLPLAYFDRTPRGELLSRVTNDIDNVGQSLQQTLSQLLNAVLTVLGVAVMMFWVSWQLALVTILVVPVAAVVTMMIGKVSQKRFVQQWKTTGELNGTVEEAFTGHSLVKVFGRRAEVQARFDETNDRLFQASFGAQVVSSIIMPVNFFLSNLNFVVVAVMGGLRVASGQMSLGDVMAFIQYSRMFTQPIAQIASMANLLQSGVASAERVFEVLDAQEMTPEAGGALPSGVRGAVRFEDVSFSYTPEQHLIEHLDLDVAPGSTVAIVGPTGAGKTTLVNLLMRFYEVRSGRITLDGVDIASIPRATLRSEMGMVLQDTWLFQGTIWDNIAYGRPGATRDEVLEAARATFVDRFVHALPDGYETVIDDEGSNISAGEKQLVTIARAFLADPTMLILDEATSSVDTRTEVLVQHAMAALRADRTSFVIAHRLSTIRDADVILVMENGTIVEQGSHEALVAAGGAYARLYESQFAAG